MAKLDTRQMAQALVVTESINLLMGAMLRGMKDDPSVDTLLSLAQALQNSLFWSDRVFKTRDDVEKELHEEANRRAWDDAQEKLLWEERQAAEGDLKSCR